MRTRSQNRDFKSTTHPYVLLIVDMQLDFQAADCWNTQQRIIQLLKHTIHDGALIVFAHYESYGPTYSQLTHPVRHYPHVLECAADQNDKSDAFIRVVAGYGAEYHRIVVTGVNTGACVKATVDGLRYHHHPAVEICIDRKGCNDEWPESQQGTYDYLEAIGVTVI